MDPQPASQPPKQFSILPVLLSSLSFLLLLSSAFLAYQNMQLKKQIEALQTTPIPPISQITPTTTVDPTENWKTYIDPNGLYTFKYPLNYSLGHYATDNSPLLINNRIEWGITQHAAGGCIGDCPIITNTQDRNINNYSAKLYEGWVGSIGGETPQSYLRYEIKQPSANNYFVITLWELDRTSEAQNNYSQERKIGSISEDDIAIFTQILSTFKFLDQKDASTYTCPPSGYVDCMPILDEAKKKACSEEAMTWYKINCPDFKGGAM